MSDQPPSPREIWNRDTALRERELLVKEAELEIKRKEQIASGWRNPLVVAILAAAFAGLGNAWVAITNGRFQRELEDQKAEQSRILEMLKTGDADTAAENLKFLLDAGLIANQTVAKNLKAFLGQRKPGTGPALPAPAGFAGNSLEERVSASSSVSQASDPEGAYQVVNHVLRDASGKPVSLVEVPGKGVSRIEPRLIVLHATSTHSAAAVVSMMKQGGLKASAHLIIDRDGKVTQLVPFDIAAWHAGPGTWKGMTGLNNLSIGVEFVNAGKLDKWRTADDATSVAPGVSFHKDEATGEVSAWQSYTPEQIEAGKKVVRVLGLAYPGIEAVVGHSDIDPRRKVDPGPALPMQDLQQQLKRE